MSENIKSNTEKTIHDAWAALDGDLEDSFFYSGDGEYTDTHLHWDKLEQHYVCFSFESRGAEHQFICTVDEFNNYEPPVEEEEETSFTTLADTWKLFGGIHSLSETEYLTSSEANTERLMESIAQLESKPKIEDYLSPLTEKEQAFMEEFIFAVNEEDDSEDDEDKLEELYTQLASIQEKIDRMLALAEEKKAIDYMQYAYDKGNSMRDVLSEIKKGYVQGVSFTK